MPTACHTRGLKPKAQWAPRCVLAEPVLACPHNGVNKSCERSWLRVRSVVCLGKSVSACASCRIHFAFALQPVHPCFSQLGGIILSMGCDICSKAQVQSVQPAEGIAAFSRCLGHEEVIGPALGVMRNCVATPENVEAEVVPKEIAFQCPLLPLAVQSRKQSFCGVIQSLLLLPTALVSGLATLNSASRHPDTLNNAGRVCNLFSSRMTTTSASTKSRP